MRKNFTMRVAIVMVALTLITSCFVSATYAKYVTSGTATDTARVAKWGVQVTNDSATAFSASYAPDDGTYTASAYTVLSANGTDKLVAPGTTGNFTQFTVSGTPEVASRVVFSITQFDISDDYWKVDSDGNGTLDLFYCPLEITIDGTTVKGLDYSSATAFENAVKAYNNITSQDFAPNTAIAPTAVSISWSWQFENGTGSVQNQSDAYDTQLGNTAVNNDIMVEIEVTCTVTQID